MTYSTTKPFLVTVLFKNATASPKLSLGTVVNLDGDITVEGVEEDTGSSSAYQTSVVGTLVT